MSNPYNAPGADMSQPVAQDESYDPQLFAINGRIGRLRYLAYSLVYGLLAWIAVFVLTMVTGASLLSGAMGGDPATAMGVGFGMMVLINIPFLIIAFVLARRRLNDLDLSGWFGVFMIIPLVNVLFALYLIFAPGSKAGNRFGPRPGPNSTAVVIGALALPIIAIIGIVAAIAIPAYSDYQQRAAAAQVSE